jgi:hypothetical protein
MPEDFTIEPDKELLKNESKNTKEILNSLDVITALNKTHIIVIAVSKDRTKNKINRISCKKGLHLGGILYDAQNDNYLVDCADYLNLGFVPVSFKIKTKSKSNWENWIPIPENVLNKNFTLMQKKELKNFKSHFNSDEFEIQFLQMIDAN